MFTARLSSEIIAAYLTMAEDYVHIKRQLAQTIILAMRGMLP